MKLAESPMIRINQENYKELAKMKENLTKTIQKATYDDVITLLIKSKKKTPFVVILKNHRGRAFTCAGSYQTDIEKTIGQQFNIDFLFG